ncbi:cell division protein ZapE [Haliea sp. E1-2-M8]|uniref:cell division protein ZapE n=1 Tax=Haliea sp. E1-2-M8 TaxID=3064706 RepID=UPI00272157AF|nr:cell division protein ZapE [Haliea sp. E1-2-M8]MDO8864076.1 cell division protein ZapE [Haliea sp. E1-2-M8]
MDSLSPQQAYQLAKTRFGFVADSSQQRAVQVLETCFRTLHTDSNHPGTGVYLWGPVGRGKTWLMDNFHRGLKVPSRRLHFHRFMQWLHRRLFELTGTADPLLVTAAELAREVRVLCFDELFVSDIADAMLLGRFFQAIFDAGIVVVATSNQRPEQLYIDGFNRERFLPAIAALQRHMHVVEVDGDQDHRLHPGAGHRRYWVADPHALQRAFTQLSGTVDGTEECFLLNDRQLSVIRYCTEAIWLRFEDLCGQPFAAADFISLCDRFPAILLGDVPDLSAQKRAAIIARGTEDGVQQVAAGDRELPMLSSTDDSVRRFIALVDECYDRLVPLYIEAAVPLMSLYTEGSLLFPFRRTLSRLQEMQLQRFGMGASFR